MYKYIILSLIGSFAMVCEASAIREKSEIPFADNLKKHEIKGEITVNGQTFHLMAPPSTKKSQSTRAAAITPIITEAPGTKKLYTKDVIGYSLAMPFQSYAVAASITWDGNDAYFYDIITAAPMERYVKASLENNEIVLPMNQTVLDFDDEKYAMNLGLLRPIFSVDSNNDVYVWFEYSDDYDSVVFSIDPMTGAWVLENLAPKYPLDEYNPANFQFPYYVIGYYYTDEYDWSGYCDVFQAYDEFNYQQVELPENLPMQRMTYINSEEMGVIVSVYEDKDALYIKGLSPYIPDAIFKGDLIENGTKLSVAPNQFIGIEYGIYYVLTANVKLNQEGQIENIENDTPVYFNIERDSSTGKILSIKSDGSSYALAFNDDPIEFWPVDIFNNLELSLQESFAGTPSTPYDAYYEDYSDWLGANYIFFRLSSFAENHDIIDIDNLYYSIFINGEIVEFEEESGFDLKEEEITMYRGITHPTTIIPYTFANDVDLYEDAEGTFVVGLYAEGIDTVGVEALYKCDGVTTYSQLVTIDTATGKETIGDPIETKVETVNNADVLSVDYYDLKGLKITTPSKGLYVKKYNLKDGTSKTTKVVVR